MKSHQCPTTPLYTKHIQNIHSSLYVCIHVTMNSRILRLLLKCIYRFKLALNNYIWMSSISCLIQKYPFKCCRSPVFPDALLHILHLFQHFFFLFVHFLYSSWGNWMIFLPSVQALMFAHCQEKESLLVQRKQRLHVLLLAFDFFWPLKNSRLHHRLGPAHMNKI